MKNGTFHRVSAAVTAALMFIVSARETSVLSVIKVFSSVIFMRRDWYVSGQSFCFKLEILCS